MRPDLSLQSWPQVPCIAHFCSLFREAFNLFEFDIQDLEEALLLHGSDQDDEEDLVLCLILKLLQGSLPLYKKRINRNNYNTYLKQFLISKQEDAEEDKIEYTFENPFEENEREFAELELKEKVLLLHHLCELRLDAPDISEKVKHLEGSSLRVDPLGVDSEGTTYWYFYGTRLYKENHSGKKKYKKHKKLKKKKRKKSRESTESIESVVSSEEDLEGSWSIACHSVEDWDQLVLKYKHSDRREDRKLFRLLNDCFLPEIREMYVEKKREEKRKMRDQLNRRSSSRVEVLKKHQEERDRLMALKLAKEKPTKSTREMRGRKRGRKRKHRESDDEDDDDEEEEEANEDSGDDSSEAQGDREERAKQREMMKEMRARREAEKMVESKFREEVTQQRAESKEVKAAGRRGRKKVRKEQPERPKPASSGEAESEGTKTRSSSSASSREQSPEISEPDSDDVYKPPKDYKSSTRTNFSNALIRAGTKSTKDCSLEKEKQKSIKEILTEKPAVRRSPGLLLQAAGKGLLNKAKDCPEEAVSSELSSPRRGSGISFGLWGGHLPVDSSIISSSLTSSYEDKPDSDLGRDKKEESAKKVFSNWGGDFFKKNLDFRANTNRILEKLSKSTTELTDGTAGNGVS